MKWRGLVIATVLTLLATTGVLARAGWFAASLRSLPPHGEARSRLKAHDPFASEAAYRWRRCQPTHWRACVLQP